MKISFIGTGVMGAPMAQHLLKAGHDITVYNRTKEKAQSLLEKGAVWADSVAEAVQEADMVITIVGYPKDVREVYLEEGGIVNNAKKGAVLIDMTTTDPSLSEEIYLKARENGLEALDAPVSGGDIGAQNATLSIMVGGDEETFEKAKPVFEVMGKNIRYMGKAGSGQHTKLANQIAIAGTLSGVAEALSYAKAMDLDLNEVIEAISSGAAGSWQLQNLGPKMAVKDYDPGFFTKHMVKDLNLADSQSQKKDLNLEINKLTRDHLEQVDQNLGTQGIFEYYQES